MPFATTHGNSGGLPLSSKQTYVNVDPIYHNYLYENECFYWSLKVEKTEID